MANKRKCPNCKSYNKEFIVIGVQAFCNYDCATEYAYANKGKGEKIKAKEERKKLAERKEKLKSKSDWARELQALVNRYVRLRDINDGCISCEKTSTWKGQWHCSHYYSRGHSSGLRFNLWNMHKSCSVCNSHLSGNIGEYTPRLIEKIGQEKADWLLCHKSDIARYDVEYLKKAIKIARKAVKRIKRQKGIL